MERVRAQQEMFQFAFSKSSGKLGSNCDRKACMDCLDGQIFKMAGVLNTDFKKLSENIVITEDDIPGAKISLQID